MKIIQSSFLFFVLVTSIFVVGSDSVRSHARIQSARESSVYRSSTLEALLEKGFPQEVELDGKHYKKISECDRIDWGIGRSYSVQYTNPKNGEALRFIVYFQEDKPAIPEMCLQKEASRSYTLVHRGSEPENTSFWHALLVAQGLKK